ncbi:DUF1102 domain-containing protein [Halobacteria archaeon AArc-curdl1]|uniref:DUF1102 domain-containing protein n=1 Tax=Natronosalvus hydrolyticus TaxID=2979988 RepID=A0AAP2Z4X5_9EURY|nr:DUF1102 domain-containing protein [Halobacteria archaeon AArc-curdl1]
MERRKFLIGVGGSSLGASAIIGSGAFTRIESQRRVKIEVAEDPDAYLGLDGCPDSDNSSYTEIDDSGHLAVEMSPENENSDNDLGSGINSDSFTWFDNVFQICNQGKQDVCVWIDASITEGLELDEDYDDEDIVDFYLGGNREQSLVGEENGILLPVGECICVGIATVTKGLEAGDQLLEDDEIVIHADADAECDSEIVDNGRTAISFAAFCSSTPPTPTADIITISNIVFKTNDELEPVGFSWKSDDDVPIDRIVLKGGREWYVYNFDPGQKSGFVEMEGEDADAYVQPGDQDQLDELEISERSPCGDGFSGVKFEWDSDTGFTPEDD